MSHRRITGMNELLQFGNICSYIQFKIINSKPYSYIIKFNLQHKILSIFKGKAIHF